jgi:tetratricopeptide (TPR) repeat protein
MRLTQWIGIGLLTAALGTPAGARADHASDQAASASATPEHSMQNMGGEGSTKLFDNFGTWHRTIGTKSPDAQKYFDQGLRQLYGFDMQGSERSFRKATEADSNCAACWWGVAMSLGPHINIPALPDRTHGAYEAIQKARTLMAGASETERALIEALTKRYREPQPSDPKEETAAETEYSVAMGELAKRFPSDPDVVTLYAESMMDLQPWDYWNSDGTPKGQTALIVATLEGVMKQHPDQPGANHLYIHAIESSKHPEKALAAADRVRTIMPGVGHMTHMPSHIYERVGRYDESATANRKAIEYDNAYRPFTGPMDFFPMYSGHNVHFLGYTMMKQGRSTEAMEKARHLKDIVPVEMLQMMPGFDIFYGEPDFFMVQFERWDEILAEPPPPAVFPFLRALRHWSRGMAFAGKGQLDQAAVEAESLTAVQISLPEDMVEGFNSARGLLDIASHMLAGHMAGKKGDWKAAVTHFEQAVKLEDGLRYDEPPDWLAHTRWTLGPALIKAGRAADAERVCREDLKVHPNNGWSLHCLAASLRAQGKKSEADKAEASFKKAWPNADVKLAAAQN